MTSSVFFHMLISINLKITADLHGGGFQFRDFLAKYLQEHDHVVINDLKPDKIDIILLISPLPNQSSASYDYLDVEKYLLDNPGTIVVHRINYCNLARSHSRFDFDKYLKRANKCADYTVYISNWIKEIYEKYYLGKGKPNCVIHNGADQSIFNNQGGMIWHHGEKMKIVTHHWSKDLNKGHDIYKYLDSLLNLPEYSSKFEFTYIGNIPESVDFKNVKILPVKFGKELAEELKRHHFYLTAAKNEAAGMHHIEAVGCGLPILFRNDSALPEYCKDYGLGFDGIGDFRDKLKEMHDSYRFFSSMVCHYRFTASAMAEQYLNLFVRLKNESKKVSKQTPFFNLLNRIKIGILKMMWISHWKRLLSL